MFGTMASLIISALIHGECEIGELEARKYYCGDSGELGILVSYGYSLAAIVWEFEGVEHRREWREVAHHFA